MNGRDPRFPPGAGILWCAVLSVFFWIAVIFWVTS